MRAAVFESFGEPASVLRVIDRPRPALGQGQVLVRMLASPVNPSDLMTIRGVYGIRPTLPAVPGYEGVGIVEEANAGLFGKYLTGKRVAVLKSVSGNWAEYAVAAARSVIPLSPKLSVDQAAMFFVNPATAFVMTRRVLAVPQGKWLLQSAGNSAVGQMVVRLGRTHGFRTISLVRDASQIAKLKGMGADAVLVFDAAKDSAESLKKQVQELTGGQGVPFALDPVGGAVGSAIVNCLGPAGRLLVYGTLSAEPLQFSSRSLMTVGSKVEGFWLSLYMDTLGLLGKLNLVGAITKGILSGDLDAEVGSRFPLEQVVEAVQAAEAPGKSGKVLLLLGADTNKK